MNTYRRRGPQIVNAFRYQGYEDGGIPEPLWEGLGGFPSYSHSKDGLNWFDRVFGWQTVNIGDWIVIDDHKHWTHYTDEDFRATFVEVPDGR